MIFCRHRRVYREPADARKLRNCNVRVGNHEEPVHHRLVALQMSLLVEWYNNVEHHLGVLQLVAEMHYRLVYIHPFRNGNGRCARLLANFVLARKEWRPIILKELMRMTYYDTIHHADKTGGPGHGDLRLYRLTTTLARTRTTTWTRGTPTCRAISICPATPPN
ncbi:hypothetical protein niasHT_008155 [Heterodera trifolii]|uniref:Fido domain-containing protein n=1 Tax=Heterodera trifolii TaxID=157864 RepID=A0ABD2M034_9BILA